jgi:hypothetical protein
MLRSAILCSLLVSCIGIPSFATACGESLYRVGKGVAYREYSAPLPGKILIVASTADELAMAARLEAAGHDVRTVPDPARVGAALQADRFDVVMSLYRDHDLVATAAGEARSNARYLPVALADSDEVNQARVLNPHAPDTDDSVKTFLKAIHRTLKAARA